MNFWDAPRPPPGSVPWTWLPPRPPSASKQNSLAVYSVPPKQPSSASAFEVPTRTRGAPHLPPLLLVLQAQGPSPCPIRPQPCDPLEKWDQDTPLPSFQSPGLNAPSSRCIPSPSGRAIRSSPQVSFLLLRSRWRPGPGQGLMGTTWEQGHGCGSPWALGVPQDSGIGQPGLGLTAWGRPAGRQLKPLPPPAPLPGATPGSSASTLCQGLHGQRPAWLLTWCCL